MFAKLPTNYPPELMLLTIEYMPVEHIQAVMVEDSKNNALIKANPAWSKYWRKQLAHNIPQQMRGQNLANDSSSNELFFTLYQMYYKDLPEIQKKLLLAVLEGRSEELSAHQEQLKTDIRLGFKKKVVHGRIVRYKMQLIHIAAARGLNEIIETCYI